MDRCFDRCWLTLALVILLHGPCAAQQNAPEPIPPGTSEPLTIPPIPQLLLSVERNEKAAEAAKKDYTYHEHFEMQEVDKDGKVKKTVTYDADAVVIDGVNVDRTTARDGKPLTAAEVKKEDERIDREVAKAKERRARREAEGKPTDPNGNDVITASRVLELGTFSNPRNTEVDGRAAIMIDYAGDPHAKTRNPFETVVRDLVGTIWIDRKDQVLVRAQGRFLNDFKLGGGLLADIKSGTTFDMHYTQVNGEVWLPSRMDSNGKVRLLLLIGFNGRFTLAVSDYKKFRTTSTIIDSDRVIGSDGQPVADPTPAASPDSVPATPPDSASEPHDP